MLSYRELVKAFQEVGANHSQPVLVHASLSSIGEVRGGAESVLGALLSLAKGLMAPAFTYTTMVTPEVGPEENAITYGTGRDHNRMAEFYRPEMPCDPAMGILPELLRQNPNAQRSSHPILSFTGINVAEALDAQTIEEPLAPIGVLAEQDALVMLIGVEHTVNTSIHYAEYLAGRKQFTRWALTRQGARACPGFPGCSDGFQQAAAWLRPITRTAQLGQAVVQVMRLKPMLDILVDQITREPLALLCDHDDERCAAVRRAVQSASMREPLDGS